MAKDRRRIKIISSNRIKMFERDKNQNFEILKACHRLKLRADRINQKFWKKFFS